jgi:hypothetical protein
MKTRGTPPTPARQKSTAELVLALRHWIASPPPWAAAWCAPFASKAIVLGLSMSAELRRAAVRILEWYPRPLETGPGDLWLHAPAGVHVFPICVR